MCLTDISGVPVKPVASPVIVPEKEPVNEVASIFPLELILPEAVIWPPFSLTINNSLLSPPSLCNINFPLALDSNLPVISPLPAVSISNFNWSNLDLNLNIDESPETPDNLPNSIVGCAVVLGIKISPLVAPPVLLNSDVLPVTNKPLAVIFPLALMLPSTCSFSVGVSIPIPTLPPSAIEKRTLVLKEEASWVILKVSLAD